MFDFQISSPSPVRNCSKGNFPSLIFFLFFLSFFQRSFWLFIGRETFGKMEKKAEKMTETNMASGFTCVEETCLGAAFEFPMHNPWTYIFERDKEPLGKWCRKKIAIALIGVILIHNSTNIQIANHLSF